MLLLLVSTRFSLMMMMVVPNSLLLRLLLEQEEINKLHCLLPSAAEQLRRTPLEEIEPASGQVKGHRPRPQQPCPPPG